MADDLPVQRQVFPLTSGSQPTPSTDPDGSNGLAIREIWGLLLRNRWLILASTICTLAAALVYVIKATPVYEAKATIRIEEKESSLPRVFRSLEPGSGIGTEVEVLRSRSLSEDAIGVLGLQAVVTNPRRVPRSQLLREIAIARDAQAGTYIIRRLPGGLFSLLRESDGARLATGALGERLEAAGVRIILAPGAAGYPVIEFEVQDFEQTVDRITGSLAVSQPSRDAQILVVGYQDPDPKLASEVPNTLARRFIQRRREAQKTEARSTVAFLRQQLDTLAVQLKSSEDTLRRFREQEQVVDPAVEGSTQVTRFVQLQAERSGIDAERSALAELITAVRDSAERTRPGAPSPYRRLLAFPTLLRNQSASDLLKTLATLEDQRAELLARRTMSDPDVQAMSARIGDVEEQLRLTVTTYLQGLTNQRASLDTTLAQYSHQLSRIPYRQLEFARMQRQPKILEDMYALLQTRLKEAEIAQAVEDASVRIVDEAASPEIPIKPRRKLMVIAGLISGLVAGAGLAFLRELLDRSIHTRSDVALATGLPVLGLIPRIPTPSRGYALIAEHAKNGKGHASQPTPPRPLSAGPTRPPTRAMYTFLAGPTEPASEPTAAKAPTVQVNRPLPILTIRGIGTTVTEAYSSLQTNLLYSRKEGRLQTLVFTSALPGDGKTTNAVNLALTLAQRGVRVVLVDADLRRGIMHHLFNAARQPGLADVLTDSISLTEALHTVQIEQGGPLHFLTGGRVPPNPIAMLEGQAMTDLLEQLRGRFEAVILDAPPINIITDAAVLGANADGVVIVVRAGVTQTGALEYAMHQLQLVRARVLGVVLNDIDFKRDASYDPTYRYYSQYESYIGRSET